jgi:hypothetical protein
MVLSACFGFLRRPLLRTSMLERVAVEDLERPMLLAPFRLLRSSQPANDPVGKARAYGAARVADPDPLAR